MRGILVLLLMAACALGGWSWRDDRANAEIAKMKADRERETSTALSTLAARYQEAESRAEKIDGESRERTSLLERQLKETKNEIKSAARGRPCLGGAVLGVLEHAPGIRIGPARPPAADALHGGPGRPSADPADEGEAEGEYATDTEVADWIATAGAYYERCRGQLRDIRLFEDGGRK